MNRFPKRQRITSQKLIDLLFASGKSKSFVAFPLRAVWLVMESPEDSGNPEYSGRTPIPDPQVLVSVPKKRLHHAVDRNRAKRQIREAYRLCRKQLTGTLSPGRQLAVAFVWLADRPEPSSLVSARVGKLVTRIAESL